MQSNTIRVFYYGNHNFWTRNYQVYGTKNLPKFSIYRCIIFINIKWFFWLLFKSAKKLPLPKPPCSAFPTVLWPTIVLFSGTVSSRSVSLDTVNISLVLFLDEHKACNQMIMFNISFQHMVSCTLSISHIFLLCYQRDGSHSDNKHQLNTSYELFP